MYVLHPPSPSPSSSKYMRMKCTVETFHFRKRIRTKDYMYIKFKKIYLALLSAMTLKLSAIEFTTRVQKARLCIDLQVL